MAFGGARTSIGSLEATNTPVAIMADDDAEVRVGRLRHRPTRGVLEVRNFSVKNCRRNGAFIGDGCDVDIDGFDVSGTPTALTVEGDSAVRARNLRHMSDDQPE